MGKKITDSGFETITSVVPATDLWNITRPSAGANGTKKGTITNLLKSTLDQLDLAIYTIHGQMLTPQAANAVIIAPVSPPFDIKIPAGGTLSGGKALVAATGVTTFSLRKNGVQFGTMGFTAGGTVPTFTIASDTSFLRASNDYFTCVGPASPDSTLALLGFDIAARRIL